MIISRNRLTVTIRSYIDLMKPNILLMVLITTLLGYYLGSDGEIIWTHLIWTMIGTSLSAGGAVSYTHLRAHETREDLGWRVMV